MHGEFVFHLFLTLVQFSNLCQASIVKINGELFVSLRKMYRKNDEILPTCKGIYLSVEKWNALMRHSADIDASFKRK